MSKEAAAAILTQVYVDILHPPFGATRDEPVSPGVVDGIGHIYAAFHARLDLFQSWGEQYAPKLGKQAE